MKKVLIVSASPRKNGNSDLLSQQFEKGAREAGNNVEVIYLRDYEIRYCLGCHACVKLGKCVQKDDFNTLMPKMMDSDVIVFSSPIYFYSLTGQMKTFIDRCVTLYERMRDKDFYFMLTAADERREAFESTFKAYEGFTDCFDGMRLKGRIYGTAATDKGDVKNTPAYDEAYQMGLSVK
jgi:multimeric flavodoxin WrbA